ncbi:nitrous oxide reductase family maturation protein NosD [Pleomorphomonas carboxyditropha]|uniref:Carbohydrate-binding protein n=1 Tax=Pleomorphomonas carboxyditropha TaxID=2023338 RepID=A0A2G9WR74_9HYPH|nr:nitrous oxide reductase family maturation protein NosD [Pleomorphomonas carboxyditropha]PIO97217.1 carbohydrate-binding protein [Pleomorphomonas carboxyditropha]
MTSALRLLVAVLLGCTGAAGAAEIAVGNAPDALRQAIETAAPGDVLRLGNARYDGPIVIDRPLTLIGDRDSRIVGNGEGTVISVHADDVTLKRLYITGSGRRLDQLDSGIALAKGTRRARVEGNRIVMNLIGVDVQGAIDATVSGNTIVGRTDLHRAEMGSGIYVWNAPGLLVEHNDIRRGRDGIFVSTSMQARYRFNRMQELRFAFHSMYANDIVLEHNVSRGNMLGFAFMFSRNVTATDNLSVGDATHGLFLNSVNTSRLIHNEVRDGGEKCLFIYGATRNRIEGNRLEGCDIGIHLTGGAAENVLTGNAVIGNRTQVKYVGTRWLEWSGAPDEADKTKAARGNFWSDHVAFDIDGDGLADSPYRPNDTVDVLTWSQPMTRLLLGAPAVQLIRWAQSRFPGLLPGGVVDSHPLMSPEGAGPRPPATPLTVGFIPAGEN